MKKLLFILGLMLSLLPLGAQDGVDLLQISEQDSLYRDALFREDQTKLHYHWGMTSTEYAFPFLSVGFRYGYGQTLADMYYMASNYGFVAEVTPFQFSTYQLNRKAFFSGGVSFGLYMNVQPETIDYQIECVPTGEHAYSRNRMPAEKQTVCGYLGGSTVAVPLAATFRLKVQDVDRLSVGITPFFGIGAVDDYQWQIKSGQWNMEEDEMILPWSYYDAMVGAHLMLQYQHNNWALGLRGGMQLNHVTDLNLSAQLTWGYYFTGNRKKK